MADIIHVYILKRRPTFPGDHAAQAADASLVDHISFLIMRRRDVTTAFAFDPDFVSAGFRLSDA